MISATCTNRQYIIKFKPHTASRLLESSRPTARCQKSGKLSRTYGQFLRGIYSSQQDSLSERQSNLTRTSGGLLGETMKFLHASQRCTLCLFLTLPLLAIGFALYIADVWLFDRAHVSLFYPPSHHSPAPLEVLCASKTWSEGLYLICDHK